LESVKPRPLLDPPTDNSGFFGIHWYLVSSNSRPTAKIWLPKTTIRSPNRLGKIGEVVNCWVFSAPNSRAAVSLSYLTARASSECGKTLSLAIVRQDNPL